MLVTLRTRKRGKQPASVTTVIADSIEILVGSDCVVITQAERGIEASFGGSKHLVIHPWGARARFSKG